MKIVFNICKDCIIYNIKFSEFVGGEYESLLKQQNLDNGFYFVSENWQT